MPRTTLDILRDKYVDARNEAVESTRNLRVRHDMIATAEVLFNTMDERGISVEEFSRMSKISRGALGGILSCMAGPNTGDMQKLSNFLRVLGVATGHLNIPSTKEDE